MGSRNKIGDIRPQNIFISEKGKIRLANPFSWPEEPSNQVKTVDGYATYLAPEEI